MKLFFFPTTKQSILNNQYFYLKNCHTLLYHTTLIMATNRTLSGPALRYPLTSKTIRSQSQHHVGNM